MEKSGQRFLQVITAITKMTGDDDYISRFITELYNKCETDSEFIEELTNISLLFALYATISVNVITELRSGKDGEDIILDAFDAITEAANSRP